MKVTELFVKSGLCKSNKEAKRLIKEGGAKINDIVVDDPNLMVHSVKEGGIVVGHFEEEKFIVHECMSK